MAYHALSFLVTIYLMEELRATPGEIVPQWLEVRTPEVLRAATYIHTYYVKENKLVGRVGKSPLNS